MSAQETMIRLVKVRKALDGDVVLDGVDLDVPRGQTVVIIGPSGCGKTVLLKHIVVLFRPDSGKVYFKGQEISGLSERRLAPIRRQMGFLFQSAALFDSMTVEENVCFPLAEHGVGTVSERRDRCREMLSLVGLEGLESRLPQELSGGQQRRVALARAVVMRPEVILYDEPTTGLDPIRADLINELILKLQDVLGATAIVVTHEMNSARKIGDRLVMLHKGRFIEDTTPDKLDSIDNEIVSRFVYGQADDADLAHLRGERFASGPERPRDSGDSGDGE